MRSFKTLTDSILSLMVLLGFIVLLQSCKEDSTSQGYSTPIEEAYFDDYDSPVFKWGYIDVTGSKVLKAKWDALKEMQDPLTAANYEGKWLSLIHI